jgi:hypothetical protein
MSNMTPVNANFSSVNGTQTHEVPDSSYAGPAENNEVPSEPQDGVDIQEANLLQDFIVGKVLDTLWDMTFPNAPSTPPPSDIPTDGQTGNAGGVGAPAAANNRSLQAGHRQA